MEIIHGNRFSQAPEKYSSSVGFKLGFTVVLESVRQKKNQRVEGIYEKYCYFLALKITGKRVVLWLEIVTATLGPVTTTTAH